MFYQVKKLEVKLRVFKPDKTPLRFFKQLQNVLLDQLILVLIFRFGALFCSKKLAVKFSPALIRQKDTH